MNDVVTFYSLQPLWPELFMALLVMGLLILGAFKGDQSTRLLTLLSIGGLLLVLLFLLVTPTGKSTILNGFFILDTYAVNIKIILVFALTASYMLSVKYLYDTGFVKFEYPLLILLAGMGMFLMVSAHHLLSLYMALELQSLSLYILAAFHRNSIKSTEAGVKYFILGAISSGFILFGISLLYGFTGELEYTRLANAISGLEGIERTAIVFGMIFIIAGIAFKISAVPFHMWTPDVYEGAPLPVTAFFAIAPKLAALAMLIRLLVGPFETLVIDWQIIIGFLSVMSMIWAAFAGLVQKDLKRLMAYSSIGNIGYALLGVVMVTTEGVSASIFYLMLYMVMTAGVFSIILCLQRDGMSFKRIENLAGLSKNHPVLAYSMAILMLSMSGLPPLSGFFGKMIIFKEVIAQGMYALAVIGVLTSVVAAFYYLRIIKVMFFDKPEMPYSQDVGGMRRIVMTVSVLFALCYILRPDTLLPFAQNTASDLMGKGIYIEHSLEQPLIVPNVIKLGY